MTTPLNIVILDKDSKPVTLRQLQELRILQREFYGQTTLRYNQVLEFTRKHPSYAVRIQAIGAPR